MNTSEDASEPLSLYRKFRYIEWASIALTAASQIRWLFITVKFDQLVGFSFAFLALLGLTAAFTPPQTTKRRVIYLLGQLALLAPACLLGAYRLYSLNFLMLAAKAALILPRKAMIVIDVILVVVHYISYLCGHFLFHLHHRLPPPDMFNRYQNELELNIYFLIGLITVSFLGRTLMSEQKSRESQKMLTKQVQDLAVEVERSRIAREIHDSLGHTLTSLNIQLELVLKLLDEDDKGKAKGLLVRCSDLASRALLEIRQAIKAIRGEDFDLKAAVTELTTEVNKHASYDFNVAIDDSNLPKNTRHHIFRIIQECLTNIQKYSSATQVDILLEQSDGKAKLTVRDNGAGFNLEAPKSGFGLKGMRGRAESIGGSIKLESAAGQGTRIFMTFPLER